jgi:anaphase-promoting complex subunit 3
MSKLRLAEYHFRKAAEIHPKNAVLLGCVGMVRRILISSLFSETNEYISDGSAFYFHRLSNDVVIETERLRCSMKLLGFVLLMRWFAIGEPKSTLRRGSTL